MRVFVTGGTGYIGSAIVQELLGSGHEVLGLARSPEAAQKLRSVGAQVLSGTLEDMDSLRKGAAESEAVIHVGFIHDFTRFKEVCELDRRVIHMLGEALKNSGGPLVIASALGSLGIGHTAYEGDPPGLSSQVSPRVASEEAAAALLDAGGDARIVRLANSVHGEGDPQFVAWLVAIARGKGFSAYVSEGANRWPAVHRRDAARLFRLVLERGTAGARYHGVAEEGICFREIAQAIAAGLGIPARSIVPEAAKEHFGGLASFASLDSSANSDSTRRSLGWSPSHPGLLEDLSAGHYFTR